MRTSPSRSRSQLEKLVEEQNARLQFYETLIDAARDGLWRRDIKSDSLWVSPRWWQTLGYESNAVPKNFSELCSLIHPGDLSEFRKTLDDHIQGKTKEYQCEFRLKDGTGNYRWILSKGCCRRSDAEGKEHWIAGFHADITELKDLADETERLARRHRIILDTMPQLIFVKDLKGYFRFGNRAIAEFYGTAPGDLIGKTDRDFNKNKKQVAQFLCDDRYVITQKLPKLIPKERANDKGGKVHWLTTNKVPFEDTDGNIYVLGISTFIDELVRTEQQLNRVRQLWRRQEAWANIAREIQHRLENKVYALEAILGALPRLHSDLSDRATKVIKATKQLLDDFKSLRRASVLKLGPANLLEVICEALTPFTSDGMVITVNGLPLSEAATKTSSFNLTADEQKLTDCFAELAMNSRKWMRKRDKRISVEVSRIPTDPKVGAMHLYYGSHYFRITYEDNGDGISPQNKRRIFTPFFSKDPRGSGLGLAIVKEVLEAHGGDIEEKGDYGSGATFEMVVPLHPPPRSRRDYE